MVGHRIIKKCCNIFQTRINPCLPKALSSSSSTEVLVSTTPLFSWCCPKSIRDEALVSVGAGVAIEDGVVTGDAGDAGVAVTSSFPTFLLYSSIAFVSSSFAFNISAVYFKTDNNW